MGPRRRPSLPMLERPIAKASTRLYRVEANQDPERDSNRILVVKFIEAVAILDVYEFAATGTLGKARRYRHATGFPDSTEARQTVFRASTSGEYSAGFCCLNPTRKRRTRGWSWSPIAIRLKKTAPVSTSRYSIPPSVG